MSTTPLIEIDDATDAEESASGDLTGLLQRLADHLSKRGTKPARAQTRIAEYYRKLGRPMRRDWRLIARRYLARYSGHGASEWHVGGHHVGLTHGRPGAIGEVERPTRGTRHTQLEVLR